MFFLFITITLSSCEQEKVKPSFKPVWGKAFTEVRRTFKNGVSFNDYGYQLEPEWRFTILSDDSIRILSPQLNAFITAHIQFDHDSVYNIAWTWVRLEKLTTDSVVFQALKVKDREVLKDKSPIYMTCYTDDYIQNKLHTTVQALIQPNKSDTIFISKRVHLTNSGAEEPFIPRQPVVLKSRTPLLTIEAADTKLHSRAKENNKADYTLPEYYLTIKDTYEKFSYSFSMIVDEKGELSFYKSRTYIMPEFEERTNKTLKAIVDGYLSAYLKVTPGKTLGMAHSSFVIIHVKGITER